MGKMKTVLLKGIEPKEGESYIIEDVVEKTTEVQGFKGYRVEMKSVNKKNLQEYTTMLWSREEAGVKSKLGSFIKAFEDFLGNAEKSVDTDNWIKHTVAFDQWGDKKRAVRVIS